MWKGQRAPWWLGSFVMAVCVGAAAESGEPEKKSAEPQRQRVAVKDVFHTPDDQYVVLLATEASPVRFLPIWIGETEALAIRMRLDRAQPPRPLTLNLLESVLDSGRIELTEIAIDDLKGGVFLGRVHLKQRSRRWSIDARPSDAIGLAVGQRAPIYVSKRVLKRASFDAESLLEDSKKKGEDEDPPDPDPVPSAPVPPDEVSSFEETL